MRRGHVSRIGVALGGLLVFGCTSLREIPRSEYAAVSERRHVRLVTRDGLVYEFDYVTVSGDTLTGYRHQDTPGAIEEYATMNVALEEVQKLSKRSIDWTRTGLIGGGVIAAFVVKGLNDDEPPPPSSDPGGGRPPLP
jgi:hypothetical protein